MLLIRKKNIHIVQREDTTVNILIHSINNAIFRYWNDGLNFMSVKPENFYEIKSNIWNECEYNCKMEIYYTKKEDL